MADTSPVKPGWQTTEFWLSLGALIYPLLEPAVPGSVKAVVGGVAAGVYAISRALAKLGVGRP
jgi:hypothetical protein